MNFFSGASASPACSHVKPVFDTLVNNCRKRIKEIERARRENVTEMILEGIEGFVRKPFVMETKDTDGMDADAVVSEARDLLSRCVRYYGDAGPRLKRQPEVARVLKTLAKKNRRDLEQLAGPTA